MEIHQVKYFLALCETLNFTKAAEKCNVAQPSLTRAIKKLEDEFGGDLIVRERSQTHLTELGRIMQPMFRNILNGTQTAKSTAAAFHGKNRASIRLALSHTIETPLVATSLAELARVVPELEIKLYRADGPAIAKLLEDGSVDIVVAGAIESNWNRLERWSLFTEGFSVLVPTHHELAKLETISVQQIRELNLMPRSFCEETARLSDSTQSDTTTSKAKHDTPSEIDLAAFVEVGLGHAIAPDSIRLPTTISRIPIIDERVSRSVYLYVATGRQRSPACNVLVKLMRSTDWSERVTIRQAS